MTNFTKGDLVLLIDNESPQERRQRLGLPPGKTKDSIARKYSVIDIVESVSDNKVKTKKYKFKSRNKNTNDEDTEDSIAKEERGEPRRNIYHALMEWFPLPNGLNADINDVELDEKFIEEIVIPFDASIRE